MIRSTGDFELNTMHAAPLSGDVRLSGVVSALSYALDITEGQPMGHCVRTCTIGMRLADQLALSSADRSALFYALLLKDLGCSSNSARMAQLFEADDRALKRAFKVTDWTRLPDSAEFVFRHAQPSRGPMARAWKTLMVGVVNRGSGLEMIATRCERGADIARQLGLPAATSRAIHALDEHWAGSGMPLGLQGDAIPLLARICGLSQTLEVFLTAFGSEAAFAMLERRRGSWFDPVLVDAMLTTRDDREFWESGVPYATLEGVAALEPAELREVADARRREEVALAFARVIDAKSPYTARHSEGVARNAVSIAMAMQLDADARQTLFLAGLLHDIGKLGVSSRILDKPGKLTDDEFREMQRHPAFTGEILSRVQGFAGFAAMAAAHHERLDGTGYHAGLAGAALCRSSRILAVADMAEALSAARPYRGALPRDEVLGILRRQVGTALDGAVVEALAGVPGSWAGDPAEVAA